MGCAQSLGGDNKQREQWIDSSSMLEIDAKQTGGRLDVGDEEKRRVKLNPSSSFLLIYSFLAVLGLRCCVWVFSH